MSAHMPEARALTGSAVVEVYSALDAAESPVDFLASADSIIARPENTLPLPVSLGIPDELKVFGTRAIDTDNAPRVHDYLGEMDRANASDARLWNYLALATYRSYMEKRWGLLKTADDPTAWKRRVKDRWLLHPAAITRGRLVRHGIARLWWVAHLTYSRSKAAASADDRYAYTREVFKSEDRINAIFDREVGANPAVVTAILDHAIDAGSAATDKYLQRIMQFLTLTNGYRDIGVLDTAGISSLISVAVDHAPRK
ncbi:DUF6339 family protein [Pseudohaliea rubra]|uniref:DUF6339 family protein n=1 Tax=Pseudohaliea rubra TaxID=475795 RepID=UPI001184EB39|nr:DUF6339 family protein [Pseudohaliea rubra]